MILRPLHTGSLEDLLFFNRRQFPGTACHPATIMLGGGHVSLLHGKTLKFTVNTS
jgi:hypothetical protein